MLGPEGRRKDAEGMGEELAGLVALAAEQADSSQTVNRDPEVGVVLAHARLQGAHRELEDGASTVEIPCGSMGDAQVNPGPCDLRVELSVHFAQKKDGWAKQSNGFSMAARAMLDHTEIRQSSRHLRGLVAEETTSDLQSSPVADAGRLEVTRVALGATQHVPQVGGKALGNLRKSECSFTLCPSRCVVTPEVQADGTLEHHLRGHEF